MNDKSRNVSNVLGSFKYLMLSCEKGSPLTMLGIDQSLAARPFYDRMMRNAKAYRRNEIYDHNNATAASYNYDVVVYSR